MGNPRQEGYEKLPRDQKLEANCRQMERLEEEAWRVRSTIHLHGQYTAAIK